MKNDNVKLALRDLREKAIEAHALSDGPKVNHLCSVALDFICREKPPLGFLEVRWVFILSAYWTSNFHFLGRVGAHTTDINYLFETSKDDSRVELFQFVFSVLLNLRLPQFPEISVNKLSDNEIREEDYALFELAFELYWFFSQGSSEWKNAINNTVASLDDEGQLKQSLIRLRNRLVAQNSILSGGAEIDLASVSDQSSGLAEGWLLYHSGSWSEMDTWIREKSSRIRTDHTDYSAFWSLVHFSRIQRWPTNEEKDYDEQVVSLARRFLADDRQVESRVYEKRRGEAYANLIKNARDKKYDFTPTIRLLILNAIAGLRKWDYGNYRSAVVELCHVAIDNKQELFNDPSQYWPIRTLFRLSSILAPKKTPNVFEIVDLLSQKNVFELVNECLNCAPIQTDSAYELLAYMSDLIAPEQHMEVVDWFFQRQAERKSAGGSVKASWVDPVAETLGFSPRASEICEKKSTQILSLIESSHSMQLHADLFSKFVMKAPIADASKLVEKLIKGSDSLETDENRWSILIDASLAHPDLAKQCSEFLDIKKKKSPLLRHWLDVALVDQKESENPKFKIWLRNICLDHCEKVLNEVNSKKRNLYSALNPQLFQRAEWSRTETKMRQNLIEVIQHPNVFSDSKRNLVHLLAILASDGSAANSKHMVPSAKVWLENGIPYQSFFPDQKIEPMRFARYEVFYLTSTLVSKVKGDFPSFVADWILRNDWQRNNEPVLEAYRLLITAYLSKSMSPVASAGALALSESLIASALVSVHKNRVTRAISCFKFILQTDKQNCSMIKNASREQVQSLTSLWKAKLLKASVDQSSDVRQNVAETLVMWKRKSKKWNYLEFPKEFSKTLNALAKDRRLRVRVSALHKSSRRHK